MFEYKSNKTADGLSCDVEPRLYLAVPYFRVPYGCAVLPHEKSTAFPFFNSIYFAFHRSTTRSPRTYGYGDSQIKYKNNLHKYKLYC